ncbi:MAG: hypothetical protein IPL65_16270 [Lewinellaceae bacterium]|nr:hypothetical protein [Lewinellaceae bacterium]
MQKYRLRDFEFSISPTTWNIAQDLVQEAAVHGLREVEKHFWIAQVNTPEGAVEVEIMLTPQRVKAYTCECWSENRRLMCPHIAATLLKVRQFLQQNTAERQEKARSRRNNDTHRITVPDVLLHAELAELKDFVRSYARRDRDFSLALKTWFAGHLTGSTNPFALVLDAALPKNSGMQKTRESDYRRLRKTLDDLTQQMQSAVAEPNLPLALQIATAMLEKTNPMLLRSAEDRQQQFGQYGREALEQIGKMLSQSIPPEFKASIWQQLVSWLETGHLPAGQDNILLRIISEQVKENAVFADVQAVFDRFSPPIPDLILHTYLVALSVRKLPQALLPVMDSYAGTPGAIKSAIEMFLELGHHESAALLSDHFIGKSIFKPHQLREMEDLQLRIANQFNDPERRKLKSSSGDQWPAQLQALLEQLSHTGERSHIAIVLAAEQELEALARLLATNSDINAILPYEHLLSDDFLQEHYTRLLQQFLSDHFGLPASVQVRKNLAGLVKQKRNTLVQRIIDALCVSYPDRTGLKEELMEVFPNIFRHPAMFNLG